MRVEHMGSHHDAELDEVIRMGTNIEQLIKELCPNGVPHRPLGELGIFVRGAGIQKSDLQSEGHPAIHYGQIHTYYGLSCFQTVSFISPEKAEKAKKAEPGDLVIVTTSEDTSAVAKAVAWEGESEVAVSGDALIFKHSLVNKYLSYVFQSGVFQSAKDRLVNGTKVRRVSPKDLGRIQVPVPPVEVQEEIVRILDLFTTLEAELEAELERRRLQYVHYRDALLSFNSLNSFERESSSWKPEVQWVTLGDLGAFVRGSGIQKSDLLSAGFPAVHYGQIHTVYGICVSETLSFINPALALKAKKATTGDLLIATTSEDDAAVAKAVLWNGAGEVALSGDAMIYHHELHPAYAVHIFRSTEFQKQKNSRITGAKVRRISAQALGGIIVPVPSLEEQRRIAGILDQMDALVNDLSSGLPAEITARRKQYEYYRDRLLSFPELTEPTAMASPNTQEPTRA